MPFAPFEWMLAARYLRARRAEGFISVIAWFSLLGIMVGVAALIIVMSVMNGLHADLINRILGLNGHIVVQSVSQDIGDYPGLTKRLQAMPEVDYVTPVVEGQAMASARNVASGVLVRGVQIKDFLDHSLVSRRLVAGSVDQFNGDDAVLIGSRMAARFGLTVGDSITFIVPQRGKGVSLGTAPRSASFRIVGLFDVGRVEYDANYAFLPFEAAQGLFQTGDAATGIEVMLTDSARAPTLRPAFQTALGADYRVDDWQHANRQIVTALQVERTVMFLILTLIIIVAAFNIVSSMIMLVKDKTRDIAILRTMGASRGAVMRVFLISGASVGLIGTALGWALGMGFAANIDAIRNFLLDLSRTGLFPAGEIRFLAMLPAKVDTAEVVLVVCLSIAASILATIYPSWRAARLDPVEALRYE